MTGLSPSRTPVTRTARKPTPTRRRATPSRSPRATTRSARTSATSPASSPGRKFDDQEEDGTNDVTDPPCPVGPSRPTPTTAQGDHTADDGIWARRGSRPVASETTSDPEGTYTIGLQAGDYVVCEELQTRWLQSFPNPGDGNCSNVDGAGPQGYSIEDLIRGTTSRTGTSATSRARRSQV